MNQLDQKCVAVTFIKMIGSWDQFYPIHSLAFESEPFRPDPDLVIRMQH